MKFGRYLLVMASAWMIAAAAVICFNLFVDATGILPVRVTIAGFNDWKPLREQYDWIVRCFDVNRYQPSTIIMGSSRIKQTVNPELLDGTAFAPAYNGAFNGSADFREIRSYLHYYLRTDKNLRHVFIEVFPTASLTGTRVVRTPNDLSDLIAIFFSASGLSTSIRTVRLNLGERTGAPTVDTRGFVPVPLATHHFSLRNIFNFVLYTQVLRRGTSLPPAMIDAARQVVEDCKLHQVDCRFFLSPLHADALAAIYYLGLWGELENLKRGLAQLAPTFDFTRYSQLIDERTGPVVYWPEAFHFSPALGGLMLKAMTEPGASTLPDNFGVVLDVHNIEQDLAAWREERDRWISRNPGALEGMRQAERNFSNGVSFDEVTATEMAKGGW